MAVKLGQLLVDNGLIVPAQLEQALQAQLVFGGRLGTNLVELGFISTATLSSFLAQQLSIPSLRPGELDAVDPKALRLVDAELASRFLVFPLSIEKRRLRLAMADPTDLAAADEIAFRTDHGVDAVVAPELLVLYALERFYDVKKGNRFVRLSEPMQVAAEAFSQGAVAQGGAKESNAAPARSAGGAYGLQEASADLVVAESYDDLLEVARRLLSQDLQRVAIFRVERSVVRGWCQKRCTIPSEILRDGVHDPFRQIQIPLDQSRLFPRVIGAGRPVLGALPVGQADRIVPQLLGVGPKDPVMGFALRAGNRVAAVALATGERRAKALASRERFEVLVSKLEDAIQLVHLRKRILGA